MTNSNPPFDLIIVGAGIIGTAAATTFARQGRHVLLERSLKPSHRMAGEILQPGGVAALRELGMESCLEGIDAIPVHGFEVSYRGEEVRFEYPVSETGKRVEGMSFRHSAFVGELREMTAEEGNVGMVEGRVKGLLEDGKRVIGVRCLEGGKEVEYHAPVTLLTTGQSPFTTHITGRKPRSTSKFWGLELESAILPISNHAFAVVGSGLPVLFYQTYKTLTGILIDIPHTTYSSISKHGVKTYIRNSVLPTLPACIQPALSLALEKEGGLKCMDNSYLPATRNREKGLFLLGDALNVRHPVVGGGMSVGLKDVVLLTRLLDPAVVPCFGDKGKVMERLGRFHWKRMRYSLSADVLAQALYEIFVADEPHLAILQRGLVGYIKQGGRSIEEPAGFLGAVNENPLLLFYHFVLVALFSLRLRTREVGLLIPLREFLGVVWRAGGIFVPVFWGCVCG